MRHTSKSKMVKAFSLAAVALVSVAAVPRLSSAAVCIAAGQTLRLNGLPVSKSAAKSIQGAILGEEVPVDGSGYVTQAGTRVIGITLHYDWGSGGWIQPVGNVVLKFPAHSTTGTYDTTYIGNGTPDNFIGTATIVACPSSHFSAVSTDPNAQ